MYDAQSDPYCHKGSTVLKNIPGFRTQRELDKFELAASTQRSDEPLPAGRLSAAHYKAIHHHLFQDVYAWAGKYRTVRIAKAGSPFCYPEHIAREMRDLFGVLKKKRMLTGLVPQDFAAAAADFLATLNAIHPFREGNGRTQTIFLVLLAEHAGHPLNLEKLKPASFLKAMVASFRGDNGPLTRVIFRLMDRGGRP